MTHIRCVACFFDVVLNATRVPSGEIGRKNAVGDLFLAGAVEIGDVNGVIPLKCDLAISRKKLTRETAASRE